MVSQKAIRVEIEKVAPHTQITGEAIDFIKRECERYLQRLITEALKQREITNNRLEACGIPPEKRLNLTHFRNAERKVLGEANV